MRSAVLALGAAVAFFGCGEAPLGTEQGNPATDLQTGQLGTEGNPATDLQTGQLGAAASAIVPVPDDAPPGVSIQKVTTGGSGCVDPDTLAVMIAPDGSSFLVIFDEMLLDYPPAPPVKHVNCVATVKLQVPEGWRFSVATVTTRGYAYLSSGQSARLASKYFFSGSPPGGMRFSTLTGPHDDDYTFTDDIASGGWSKCGGASIFHIHTTLTLDAVKNRDDAAYLNAQTVDGALKKTLYWQWERC